MIQLSEFKWKQFPRQLEWMLHKEHPKAFQVAIRHYGILEAPGAADNPNIIKWAQRLGYNTGSIVSKDSVPWCGVFMGITVMDAGYQPIAFPFRARAWLDFGERVPIEDAAWWDILIFSRDGGGHVGYYAGEDANNFYVFAGNQSNMVNFTWIEKSRCIGVRRFPYKSTLAELGIQKYFLSRNGEPVSTNEA